MATTNEMTGAEIVLKALADQGVEHVFGYPGGAVLPIYDEIFQQEKVKHILVRHEQCGGHMAEGFARATGEVVHVLHQIIVLGAGPGDAHRVRFLERVVADE